MAPLFRLLLLGLSVPTDQSYIFQPGYLADGDDLGELYFNIQDAKNYCVSSSSPRNQLPCSDLGRFLWRAGDRESKCQGFTFKDTDEPTFKLSIRFKANKEVTYDPEWLSYTKTNAKAQFFYHGGYLGDGEEIHSERMTLSEAQVRFCGSGRLFWEKLIPALAGHAAQEWCDENSKCRGFSAERLDGPSDKLFVHFSDNEKVTYHSGWLTYTKAPTSASAQQYTYHAGYLGDGQTLYEAFMSLEDARTYCDANVRCKGFTFDRQVATPSAEVFVRFKSDAQVSYDPEFASYVKDVLKSEL